jgi:GT2 family glycosyltransferase
VDLGIKIMTIDVLILTSDEVLAAGAIENVKENFGVTPLTLSGAKSIAIGYNQLAKVSKADILCFLHQDARLDFQSHILNIYFEYLKKPGVLGFCGSNKQIPGRQWHECKPTFGGLIQGRGEKAQDLIFSSAGDANFILKGKVGYTPVQTLDGYCLFIQRSVFEQIGGFDEEYIGWHGYDIDLCAKAIAAGYQNYVIHQPSTHFSWGTSGPTLDLALSRFQQKWQKMFDKLNILDVKSVKKPTARKIPAPLRPRKGRLKICVYTICKNELQFVERFAKSCEDADGVYVLDTGSTDGTPDALAKCGVEVEVVPFDGWGTLDEYDKLIAKDKNPWRFDIARNLSIDMCPEDADVLVCIDLDEVLVPGWRKIIEDVWVKGINHLSYFFAWSMENGKPKNCFWYEKIHSRHGYLWASPVHEALVTEHGFKDIRAWTRECLVHHYPDGSKPRSQYLPLLELGVRESTNDARIRFYLGRQYTFENRHQDAINSHTHYLKMPEANCVRERANACMQISQCFGKFKNDALAAKNESLAAEHDRQQFNWLLKAVVEENNQRETWTELADYCRIKGDNILGYWAAKKALAIPETACDGNYLVDPDTWKYKPHDLASLMGWYAGDTHFKEESIQEAWIALSYSPWDGRLEANYRIIQDCMAKQYKKVKIGDCADVDIIILAYSKTDREYNMTKQAIKSLRASSLDVSMRFVVVETNINLRKEQSDSNLFDPDVEVCFPGGTFGFNKYLKAGFDHLGEIKPPAKYLVVMNNDVTLFNPGFMSHMINGLKSVTSASPLGLREATWGLVNRNVPIDENYDINRSVNGWFLMFDRKVLNALSFEQLFPPEFTWYNGDIHYAKLLEKCGYKHGLINAAQALHLQKQSHPLLDGGISPPANRDVMLSIIGVKGKRCAEIGVERGHYSQKILAEGPSALLLVDPWKHQDESIYPKDTSNVDDNEFEKRYQEVQQTLGKDPCVTLYRSYSIEAVKINEDASLDFVYIDAIHTKEAVFEDMCAWWPKVKLGGWLCGHDYQFTGVVEAVRDFCAKENVKLTFVTQETNLATSWAIKKPEK